MAKENKYRFLFATKLFLLVFLSIFFVNEALPQTYTNRSELVIEEILDYGVLGKYIFFLEDSKRELTIKDVISSKYWNQFQRGKHEALSFGYDSGRFWLELPTFNTKGYDHEHFYVNVGDHRLASLQSINVYFLDNTVSENNFVIEKISIPSIKNFFLEKRVPHIAIPIPETVSRENTFKIILEVEAEGAVTLPIYISNTEIPKSFYYQNIAIVFSLGAICILFFYNLFIFLFIRESSYCYYICYLLVWILYIVGINKYEVIFGWYIPHAYTISLGCLTFMSLCGFIYSFINPYRYYRPSNYILGFYVVIGVIASVINFTNPVLGIKISSIAALTFVLVALFIIIICLIRKSKRSRFVLCGWFIFTISVCLYLLTSIGVIPYSFLIANANIFGTLFEATFLAIALADRFYLLQKELSRTYKELKQVHHQVIYAFGVTVEKKDPYTAGHQYRVSELAEEIAKAMHLKNHYIEHVKLASLIHDIGKIGVESDLLTKKSVLTPEEFKKIKAHVNIGYEIVKKLNIHDTIKEGILHHHEKQDGSGYPNKLKGSQISLIGKIISVADAVEAIANERPYRKGLGIKKALEIIEEGKGKSYDKEVVTTCQKVFNNGFRFSDAA